MVKITKFRDIPQLTSVGNYQVNMPLEYIPDRIKEWQEDDYYKLQLNPDFQRGHVWSEDQQIAYIDYLLRGGQSARIIYFNKPDWQGGGGKLQGDYNDFVCVDGLQRLTAVLRFMNNEIKVFGTFFCEFEDRIPFDIDLLFNVNNLKTKKEVLQWYIEFNSGGTPHTQNEIERVKRMLEKLA